MRDGGDNHEGHGLDDLFGQDGLDDSLAWAKELARARAHFLAAGREGLAGFTALTDAMHEFMAASNMPEAVKALEPAVAMMRTALDIMSENYPPADISDDMLGARRDVLGAIETVLRNEKRRLARISPVTDAVRYKIEALDAVMNVIDQELGSEESETSNKEPKRRVRKVAVE